MTTPSKLQRTAQGLRILYFAKEFTRRQAPRLGKRLELIEPLKYSSRTFPPQAMARDTCQPFRNLHEGMRLRAAGEGFRQVAWWGAVAPVYFAAGFFLGAPT